MKIRALVLAAAGKLSPALVVVSLGLVAPALRAAETAPDYAQERISGGWSGARSSLDAKGYTFEGVTKIDGWRELSGGTAGSWRGLGNLDLQLGIDAEKAFGWKDTKLFVYGLGDAGGEVEVGEEALGGGLGHLIGGEALAEEGGGGGAGEAAEGDFAGGEAVFQGAG